MISWWNSHKANTNVPSVLDSVCCVIDIFETKCEMKGAFLLCRVLALNAAWVIHVTFSADSNQHLYPVFKKYWCVSFTCFFWVWTLKLCWKDTKHPLFNISVAEVQIWLSKDFSITLYSTCGLIHTLKLYSLFFYRSAILLLKAYRVHFPLSVSLYIFSLSVSSLALLLKSKKIFSCCLNAKVTGLIPIRQANGYNVPSHWKKNIFYYKN